MAARLLSLFLKLVYKATGILVIIMESRIIMSILLLIVIVLTVSLLEWRAQHP